jgi:hypothetical protein
MCQFKWTTRASDCTAYFGIQLSGQLTKTTPFNLLFS